MKTILIARDRQEVALEVKFMARAAQVFAFCKAFHLIQFIKKSKEGYINNDNRFVDTNKKPSSL